MRQDYKKGTLRSVTQFQNHDFALEVHFNAFKTGGADGKTKGVEACVPKGGDAGGGLEDAVPDAEQVKDTAGFQNQRSRPCYFCVTSRPAFYNSHGSGSSENP